MSCFACVLFTWFLFTFLCDYHMSDSEQGKTYHQVPYSNSSVHVIGLPEGVSFGNPRDMRVTELQQIVAADQQIHLLSVSTSYSTFWLVV